MQRSPVVHASPSSHVEPEASGRPQAPVSESQTSSVQELPSSVQVFGVPAQAPAVQMSPRVHASPSMHGVPSGAAAPPWQAPATHASFSVHGFPSSQEPVVGAPGWQTPAWQASPVVQPLSSLHGVPFALLLPVQTPAWQVSTVHELPSSQTVPFAFARPQDPVAGSQTSFVQELASSAQVFAAPTHAPPEHVSFSVHGLPSSHPAPSEPACVQSAPPHCAGHSAEQPLAVPAQTPAAHTS
jgi:hypothetical protein